MKHCVLLMTILLVRLNALDAQNTVADWDSIAAAGMLRIAPMDELNSDADDYAPLQLPSGEIIFTSNRTNPVTREMALAGNHNVYVTRSRNNKVKFSYYYNNDEHSAVAGASSDMKRVFVYRAWNGGDLFVSSGQSDKGRNRHFKSLGRNVNLDQRMEQSAALWTQWLVFSAGGSPQDRDFDLYFGMFDENAKVYGVLAAEGVNSDSLELDVRFMNDGTLLFSSNRDGRFKPFQSRYDGVKWQNTQALTFLPDSFLHSDVRDMVIYDSVFFFSSNKSGNFDLYCGSILKQEPLIVQPDTPVVVIEPDTVVVTPDTVALTPFEEKLLDLEQKLDSMEFKPYKAFVQIGAYRKIKSVAAFKRQFAAFDTTAIRIETEQLSESDHLNRFLIDQTFSSLRAAAIRQQVALQQQTSPANASASPVDAFIAVYDNRNVRIVIFFNLEKNDYKILVGDKVVYF